MYIVAWRYNYEDGGIGLHRKDWALYDCYEHAKERMEAEIEKARKSSVYHSNPMKPNPRVILATITDEMVWSILEEKV